MSEQGDSLANCASTWQRKYSYHATQKSILKRVGGRPILDGSASSTYKYRQDIIFNVCIFLWLIF